MDCPRFLHPCEIHAVTRKQLYPGNCIIILWDSLHIWYYTFIQSNTFGMSYPLKVVSAVAVCGNPDGMRVSWRRVSRIHASTYGKLEQNKTEMCLSWVEKCIYNIYSLLSIVKSRQAAISHHSINFVLTFFQNFWL